MGLEGVKRVPGPIKRGRSKSYPLINSYFKKLNAWRSLHWGNKAIARTLQGEGCGLCLFGGVFF